MARRVSRARRARALRCISVSASAAFAAGAILIMKSAIDGRLWCDSAAPVPPSESGCSSVVGRDTRFEYATLAKPAAIVAADLLVLFAATLLSDDCSVAGTGAAAAFDCWSA